MYNMLPKRNRLLTVKCCSKKIHNFLTLPFNYSPNLHSVYYSFFLFTNISTFFSPFVIYLLSSTISFLFISLALLKLKQLILSFKEEPFLLSPNNSFLQRDLIHVTLGFRIMTDLPQKVGLI